jgi:hypothetical protein
VGARGVIAVRSWRLRFLVEGAVVSVEAVESGYSPDALAAGGVLEDDAAHRDFHARVSGATLQRLCP